MYWIAGIVCGLFLLLFVLAGKEEVPVETSTLLRPFYKASMYLYKKISLRVPDLWTTQAVERDLARLHPGEPLAPLKTEYFVKKTAVSFAVIVLGALLGALAKGSAESNMVLGADGAIKRGEYSEEARDISITAEIGQQKMDFQLQIEPRKLSREEAMESMDSLFDSLPEYILGENESLKQVNSDLNLLEAYEEFPIEVEWDSARPDILSDTGRVQQVTEAVEVELTVLMNYME